MEGRGTLDLWRALFLIEGLVLHAFKGILLVLPQHRPPNK